MNQGKKVLEKIMTEINQTSAKSNSLSSNNTNTTKKPEFDHKFKLMMLGNYYIYKSLII